MLSTHDNGEGGFGPPSHFVPLETSDEFHPPQVQDALNNIRTNLKRDIPHVGICDPHKDTLVIVGGGPSLWNSLSTLDRFSKDPTKKILAINDTHDWLIDKHITPWGFAMMEIAPWPVNFIVKANPTTKYFLASMADPGAFDRLSGLDVSMFHAWGGIGEEDLLPENSIRVAGGEAMSIRAINLGFVLGFRDFEMFGVDGSYAPGQPSHVYMERKRPTQQIWAAGREFESTYYLARQAHDLKRVCQNLHNLFCLRTHGDGLVQHVHRTGWPQMYSQHDAIRSIMVNRPAVLKIRRVS